jgi:putative nucleotidyltransferase with HDIG domain
MYKIIHWFMKEYPELVESMKSSEHNYDLEKPNPYHLEDVWTHTMMVCNQAKLLTNDIHVHLSALLHDIGKPESRIEKEDFKIAFHNHENVSTYKSIDVLIKFENDFPEIKIDKYRVLELINWHSDFHRIGEINELGNIILTPNEKKFINQKYSDKNLFIQSINMNESDNNGRFSANENFQSSSLKFDFLKKYIVERETPLEKELEAIMFVGIAGSGKSLLKNELLKNKNYVVLSTDEIIMEFYPSKSYNESFKLSNDFDGGAKVNAEFDKRIKESIKNKKNIIFDQQNLTKKSRKRKLNLIPDKLYKKIGIVVLAGEKNHNILLKNRAKLENKSIPEHIIKNKIKNLILPGKDEFNEIFSFINEDISSEKILINDFYQKYFKKIEETNSELKL